MAVGFFAACVAVLIAAGCGGGAVSTVAASATQPPSAPTNVKRLWSIGDSYALPSQNDGQYQHPSPINGGTGLRFSLIRNYNGANNYRNQVNPTSGGALLRLSDGVTYDWKFQTVANMAPDVDGSQNLIWQIHDYDAGTSPITVLGTQNINDGSTVWYFSSGGGTWKGTYAQGATDNWEIRIRVASDNSGTAQLWRNGALVSNQRGPNYSAQSRGAPWWNFGPYEWSWKSSAPRSQISALATLDFLFNQMDFGAETP